MQLADGTIIPSFLGARSVSGPELNENFNNFGLKMGVVTDIFFPTDDQNVSKKFIEYQVEVQYRDFMGRPVTSKIARAAHMDAFGGLADSIRWTFRAAGKTSEGVGMGSKVLILAINGELNNSVIIGGVRDWKDADDDQSLGHNLALRFNGVNAVINKDGELNVARLGPTDNLGKSIGPWDGTQTFFSFSKDGSILFGHEDERFRLDYPNKSWEFECSKTFSVLAKASIDLSTKDPGATIFLGTRGKIILQSDTGVYIGWGGAVDALVMGTKYRAAETILHSGLVAALGALAGQLTAAGAALTTAAPFLVIPIAGPIIASPFVAISGATLTSAVASITAMITAITTFEGGSGTYLSLKNRTD